VQDIHINSKEGLITDVQVFSDSLYPAMVDAVKEKLTGATYDRKGIVDALDDAAQCFNHSDHSEERNQIEEMKHWLAENI
jgi:hypothetical protein